MAMIKTLARKHGGCENIMDYIEKEGACLAYDYGDNVADLSNWAREFDTVRADWGKDAGRKYYHVMISPDPSDGCDLETLRELATSWARERYPDAQWVIGYHDEGGRLHAHIAMNAVIPSTGYKIHMSDDDVEADAKALQDMCRARGLSYFEGPRPEPSGDGWAVARGARPPDGVALSDAERRLMARGVVPWKQEVRDAMDACAGAATSWDDFVGRMAALGYKVTLGRRGVATVAHPDAQGTRKTVRATDDNLGSDYTKQGVMRRISARIGRRYAGSVALPARSLRLPATMEETIRARGARRPWLDPQDVLDSLSVLRENGFSDVSEARGELERLNGFLERQREALDALRARVEVVEGARVRARRWESLRSGEDEDALYASVGSYFEVREIEQWFEERGMSVAEYARQGGSEILREARSDLQAVADACAAAERDIRALSKALSTMERLAMPCAPARGGSRTGASGQLAIEGRAGLARLRGEVFERTAALLAQQDDERLKRLAHLQREALLREQMAAERAAGSDTPEEKQSEHQRENERGASHEGFDLLSDGQLRKPRHDAPVDTGRRVN